MDAAPGPLEDFDAKQAISIAGDRKQQNSHKRAMNKTDLIVMPSLVLPGQHG